MDLPKIDPSLLGCTWEEFKQIAIDFHFKASTLSLPELDDAFKRVTQGYFNLDSADAAKNKRASVMVLELAMEDFQRRERELLDDDSSIH